MITYEILPPPNIGEIAVRLSRIPRGIEKAAKNAVQRTLKGAKQDASRKVGARYTIKTATVMDTVETELSGLNGEMASKGPRNPLELFRIKPTKRLNPQPKQGINATVVNGQGGNIRRAFLTYRMNGVYERTGRARFPIRRLSSVSSPGTLSVAPVSSYIVDKIYQRLAKNLEHAANAVLGGFLK